MDVHVIQCSTSDIGSRFSSWKKGLKDRHYGLKIISITPHTYEDQEDNYSRSSLIIVYETYEIGD